MRRPPRPSGPPLGTAHHCGGPWPPPSPPTTLLHRATHHYFCATPLPVWSPQPSNPLLPLLPPWLNVLSIFCSSPSAMLLVHPGGHRVARKPGAQKWVVRIFQLHVNRVYPGREVAVHEAASR